MKTKTALLATTVLLATAAAPTPRADAVHFALRASVPAADSSVPSPAEIRLTFTEEPQENSMSVRLIDVAGEAVKTAEPSFDADNRRVIHVSLEGRLAAGTYTVAWRGMGDDGHPVRGDFGFTVTAQD